MARQAVYRAYLLRLWRVHAEPRPVWCASLEDPHSGAVLTFASLERAYAFLAEQIGEPEHRAQESAPEGEMPL
jgi:hypothetical protein